MCPRLHPPPFQTVTCAPGHDADAPANFRAAGNNSRFSLRSRARASRRVPRGKSSCAIETNGLAVGDKKRPQIFKPKRGAELRIVPEPGMRIQRQVRTINRQIVFHEQPEQFVFFARPRMRWRPEQSVMHNHQIRPGGDGEFHGGETGIHRRRNARDRAGVPGLQTVHRAVVIPIFSVRRIRSQYPAMVASEVFGMAS